MKVLINHLERHSKEAMIFKEDQKNMPIFYIMLAIMMLKRTEAKDDTN